MEPFDCKTHRTNKCPLFALNLTDYMNKQFYATCYTEHSSSAVENMFAFKCCNYAVVYVLFGIKRFLTKVQLCDGTYFTLQWLHLLKLLFHLCDLVLHLSLFSQLGAMVSHESVACEICAKHNDAQMVWYKQSRKYNNHNRSDLFCIADSSWWHALWFYISIWKLPFNICSQLTLIRCSGI